MAYTPVSNSLGSISIFRSIAEKAGLELYLLDRYNVFDPGDHFSYSFTLVNKSQKLVKIWKTDHQGTTWWLEPGEQVSIGMQQGEPFPEIVALNNGVAA